MGTGQVTGGRDWWGAERDTGSGRLLVGGVGVSGD